MTKEFTQQRESGHSAAVIVPFDQSHAPAFKALNLAWIREHWEPEPADFEVLDNPQRNILDRGGYIAIALSGDEVVGTCALQKMENDHWELAKMAVAPSSKGQGVGLRLGQEIIAQARARGGHRLFLESNTVLTPAINLYRKLGFVPVDAGPSPYERCNIQMELVL